MSYRDLEIGKEARVLSIKIHEMSLKLPKFEQYEEAQQIRRSSKSVKSNIVEGYGRRFYKNDYIRFIVFALASNDETIDHLETLYETKSLTDKAVFDDLHAKLQILGKKINNFLKAIEADHRQGFAKEDQLEYQRLVDDQANEDADQHPASGIQYPSKGDSDDTLSP